MARVFLGRRSSGSSFLFLYASLSAAFCFCEMTVSTLAIEVRTTLLRRKPRTTREHDGKLTAGYSIGGGGQGGTYILESLLGAPPVTLATRSRESSALRSLSWPCSSVLFFPRSSCTLIRAAAVGHDNVRSGGYNRTKSIRDDGELASYPLLLAS